MSEHKYSLNELNENIDIYCNNSLFDNGLLLKSNGIKIFNKLTKIIKNFYLNNNFVETLTPALSSDKLLETPLYIKKYNQHSPLSISHAILCKNTLSSYKQLPIKFFEFSTSQKNTIHMSNLTNLTNVNLDKSHIFCSIDDVNEQIDIFFKNIINLCNLFKLECIVYFCTRSDEYVGNIETWIKSENILLTYLETHNVKYTINEKTANFYGPRIDFLIKNNFNTELKMSSIELDFQLSYKFDIEYNDCNSQKINPIVIHHTMSHSIEYLILTLTEHYQGKFPLFLSPRQIAIIPVSIKKEFIEYCDKIKNKFKQHHFLNLIDPIDSIEIYNGNEMFSSKIRECDIRMFNYVFIVGENEIKNNCLTYRIINHKREDKYECIDDVYKEIGFA